MTPQLLASPSVDAARSLPVLLVATIEGPGAVPRGIDWVRIDGASGTLETIERRREACAHPVLFDIPGPDTRHRDTLLTTSEFLVFAAAEDFDWVNLRGVRSAEDVLHAREFLPDSVRLSVTLSTPRALRHALRPLCEVADALLFDREELRHSLGTRRTDAMLASAVRHASDRGTPTLLASGVLPSMLRRDQPRHRDVERLSDLIEDGLCGMVLTREITGTDDPQSRVDVARLLAQHGQRRRPVATSQPRPAARLGGRMSVVLDAAPVWREASAGH
ncbi:MAG TPA: hypothetical protein VKA86_17595 [Candidatus Krumholzibacteria bacterium]|nr:hypothetical protein [Candidatus Krumholzibacteria bacterium]